MLSEDYSKVALLLADRSVCLHAKYGAHYRTRIPHAGRDLAYIPNTAGVLALRMHMVQVRFLEGTF